MNGPAKLHFLGWDRSPLIAASSWLLDQEQENLGACLIAVPGGRAGRLLLARIAADSDPRWIPPRTLTQGALIDELVQLEAPSAGRMARTLAWTQALRDGSRAETSALFAQPPANLLGWMTMAERVRGLHAELVVEGHDFASLAQALEERGQAAEARRWHSLAASQRRFRESLASRGLIDPHEGRIRAVREGRVRSDARVVLVGIADAGRLLAQVVAKLDRPADALVFAPEQEATGFDELGGVVTAHWLKRPLSLDLDRWHVVATPAGQAESVLTSIARAGSTGPVTLGICDDEVTPHLAHRLEEAGIEARVGAGTPMSKTRAVALLKALAAFLEDRRQSHWASLLRHPDLGAWLQRQVPDDVLPILHLDEHFRHHLPWRADDEPAGQAARRKPVEALHGALHQLLRDFDFGDTRPLADWATRLRTLLDKVFPADNTVDSTDQSSRRALTIIDEALDGWTTLREDLNLSVTAAEALEILIREVSTAAIPPATGNVHTHEIDLLGWLELPLDDAPHLIVSGLQDGRVPETVRGDAFLPDGLRARLGLVDDARRMARDLYAMTVLRHSRELSLVSGRQSQGGESLLPSRLLFHASDTEVVERMQHFLRHETDPPRAIIEQTSAPRTVSVSEPKVGVPETFSVTAFGRYLESPRRFYLQSVLRLETHDDRAHEMDGRLYGILVHQIMECLIRPTLRANTDEEQIESALRAELARISLEIFGPNPMPTVRLQLAQLEFRLAAFAREQARRATQGWRVEYVEWPKRDANTVPMQVDGEEAGVRGTIDRIDFHPTSGRWAILDYKTGESGLSPDSAHLSKAGWKDLQLPLYTHLCMSLSMGEAPELGYIYLGRDESKIGFRLAKKLDEDALTDAFKQAHSVVRAVRDGEVEELGKWEPTEAIFAGLVGLGLLDNRVEDDA